MPLFYGDDAAAAGTMLSRRGRCCCDRDNADAATTLFSFVVDAAGTMLFYT